MKPSPIQAVRHADISGYRITRPGARYAVHPDGDARPGAWVFDGDALPAGWEDVFDDREATVMLPFLRARGTAGRPAEKPTTAGGKLIARACKDLGMKPEGLAAAIGAHKSVLSRARRGELPPKHRGAIEALLAPKGVRS